MSSTAHQKAARRWFLDAERRRKAAKLRPGQYPKNTPPAPCSPSELRYLLHDGPVYVGEARALDVLQVNRTTLSRWLSGATQVPHAAVVVLRAMAEGIPPGAGADWRGFRWSGNSLFTPAGREVSAREIEGLQYVHAHADALARRVVELQAIIDSLRRIGDSANDAISGVF